MSKSASLISTKQRLARNAVLSFIGASVFTIGHIIYGSFFGAPGLSLSRDLERDLQLSSYQLDLLNPSAIAKALREEGITYPGEFPTEELAQNVGLTNEQIRAAQWFTSGYVSDLLERNMFFDTQFARATKLNLPRPAGSTPVDPYLFDLANFYVAESEAEQKKALESEIKFQRTNATSELRFLSSTAFSNFAPEGNYSPSKEDDIFDRVLAQKLFGDQVSRELEKKAKWLSYLTRAIAKPVALALQRLDFAAYNQTPIREYNLVHKGTIFFTKDMPALSRAIYDLEPGLNAALEVYRTGNSEQIKSQVFAYLVYSVSKYQTYYLLQQPLETQVSLALENKYLAGEMLKLMRADAQAEQAKSASSDSANLTRLALPTAKSLTDFVTQVQQALHDKPGILGHRVFAPIAKLSSCQSDRADCLYEQISFNLETSYALAKLTMFQGYLDKMNKQFFGSDGKVSGSELSYFSEHRNLYETLLGKMVDLSVYLTDIPDPEPEQE